MNRPWTEQEDEILLDMVSDDIKFRVIANRIGRSRNACIGRMHRLSTKLERDRADAMREAAE